MPYRPEEFAESKRPIPGWLFSSLLHAFILVLLGLILQKSSSGTGGEPERNVGIAVAHQLPDRTQYETKPEAKQAEQAQQAAAAASAPAAALPLDAEQPLDLEGLLTSALDTPLPAGIPSDSAIEAAPASAASGTVNLGPSGSKHTTQVFGISGTGSRFLYVFDRSESMNGFGGRPLFAAKMQMIRSIRTLTDQQEFQIIFYNSQPKAFIPDGQLPRLLAGETSNKRRAEQYIRAMTAFGGTKHTDALLTALRMSPDVIFFLTDARIPRMNARQMKDVKIRAERSGTTIHTIEFGDDLDAPEDSFLRTLAAQNGGQYKYLNVGTLDAP